MFAELNLRVIGIISLVLLLYSCIPTPDNYPYKPANEIRNEAQSISDDLQAYVEGWLDGINPPEIPANLIPEGVTNIHSFTLASPDDVTYEEAWAWRYAKPINTDSIYNSLPDPNVTYLLLGPALAPFGSKVHIEGEFPFCRFFSLQMSPPLSGEEYTYDRTFGAAEVSIVDVDIDPFPGHTNPFRIGSDRNATDRSYHVIFNLAIGDPVMLSNNNFAPPFRYPGNERFGGLLQYQGPWGVNGGFDGITLGNGEWNAGNLWLRMYAPDGNDPLGNVPPPKVYYELPDGRTYFIKANFEDFKNTVDETNPAQETFTIPNSNLSLNLGWQKSYGVLMNILSGVAQVNNWTHPDSLSKIRAVDLGVTGRSQYAPAPRNYEAHATVNNYTSYLGKYVRLDSGQVAVFTGKLPTFPDTRAGLSSMTNAQCRYWSLIGYDNDPFYAPGSAVNGVMDDQIQIDDNRNYIIAFSRNEDKPDNASIENKTTWVNWGPTMDLGLILRIVTLGDDWNFDKSPTAPSLPWNTGNFASPDYDSTLINQNWHKGYMNCYLPRLHILSKSEFEALGNDFDITDIPILITDEYEIGLNDALNKSITASSVKDNSIDFQAVNANDNSYESLWVSQDLNNPCQEETIEIDLGESLKISGIKLAWAFLSQATEYQLEVSSDGINYETIYENINGDGFNDIISGLQDTYARFVKVRMNCAILFNYALHSFEIYTPETECFDQLTSVPTVIKEKANRPILFPNPTDGFVKIQCDDPELFREISIYDLSGKLLSTFPYRPEFHLNAKSGIYIITLNSELTIHSFKILKL